MLFTEVLNALTNGNGRYAQRNAWTDGSYLVFLPGTEYIWKVIPKYPPQNQPTAGNWLPTVADLQADDWKEYEKPADQEPPAPPAA